MIVFSTHPLFHSRYRLNMVNPPPRPWGLILGTYNICDGQYSSFYQSIRVVQLRNHNVMMLTETKISEKAYCQKLLG